MAPCAITTRASPCMTWQWRPGSRAGCPKSGIGIGFLFFLINHQPTLSQKLADENALVRREVGTAGHSLLP